jgi:hypothetical protein
LHKKDAAASRGVFFTCEFLWDPGYLPFFGAFLSAFFAFFAIEDLLLTVVVCSSGLERERSAFRPFDTRIRMVGASVKKISRGGGKKAVPVAAKEKSRSLSPQKAPIAKGAQGKRTSG